MAIVEVTVFHLRADADPASFLAADRRVQTELIPNQPGFLRRTTAREGTDWLVLTLWATGLDAAAYADVAEGHPVQAEFGSHIDPASVRARRFETLD